MSWSKAQAREVAKQYKLDLTDDHFVVIDFIRAFYEEFQRHPPTRLIVKSLQKALPDEKGTSAYLHSLFPEPMLGTLCEIANLPKPKRCL